MAFTSILITGVLGHIGRHISRHYLGRGWDVYGYTRDGYFKCVTSPFPGSTGSRPQVVFDDDYSFVLVRIDSETARAPDVDVLVNAMGGGGDHESWLDTSEQKWSEVYLSNVTIPMRIAAEVTARMKRRQRGRVINIASVAAVKPLHVGPEYSAAKAGCINATASLAKDLAGSGVTANCISPGLIATQGVKKILKERYGFCSNDETDFNRFVSKNVFPSLTSQLITISQLIGIIDFLSSDYAVNITGQNIIADGGYSLL